MTDPGGEQRVSTLIGERLCTHCGYNLTGQPVLREPHYRMLIVRCPECGGAAGLQEYPLLGRWAGRWAALLAALWFLVMLALWIGSGAAIFGLSLGAAELSSEKFAEWILREHTAQATATPVPGAQPGPGPGGGGGASIAEVTISTPRGLIRYDPQSLHSWWAAQDRAALLARAGGWRAMVDWPALWLWVPLGLVAFTLGAMWSVILLHLRRGRVVLWSAAVMTVALIFATVVIASWLTHETGWYRSDAAAMIGPRVLVLSLGFGAAALAAGLWLGRPLVRAMLRLLLAPRLRAPLALLWFTDGLTPPVAPRRAG
jgi:hypothetical protein